MGDITAAQKINDREWIRLDIGSIRNGIVANGAATMLAALAGGIGGSTQSSSIGMSNAIGVASRRVAYWLGPLLIVLSVFPVARAVLVATPRPIVRRIAAVHVLLRDRERPADHHQPFARSAADLRGRPRLVLSLGYEPAAANASRPAADAAALRRIGPRDRPDHRAGLNAVFRIGVRSSATTTIACDARAARCDPRFHRTAGPHNGARAATSSSGPIFGTAQAAESIGGTLPYTRSALHRGVLRRVQPRISG